MAEDKRHCHGGLGVGLEGDKLGLHLAGLFLLTTARGAVTGSVCGLLGMPAVRYANELRCRHRDELIGG